MGSRQLAIGTLLATVVACSRAPEPFAIVCGDGSFVLSTCDIERYEWPTHVVWVGPVKRRALFDAGAERGCQIHVRGKVQYSVDVVQPMALLTRNVVVLKYGAGGQSPSGRVPFAIALGYPTSDYYSGPDVRANAAVLEALQATGKLVRVSPEPVLSRTQPRPR